MLAQPTAFIILKLIFQNPYKISSREGNVIELRKKVIVKTLPLLLKIIRNINTITMTTKVRNEN